MNHAGFSGFEPEARFHLLDSHSLGFESFGKSWAYLADHGRIAVEHRFADDFKTTARMTFTLRFFNDGERVPFLFFDQHYCYSREALRVFVDGEPIKPVGVLPAQRERTFFEIPPMGSYAIEVDAEMFNGEEVLIPGCALYDVQGRSFEVEFTYFKMTSDRITVDLTNAPASPPSACDSLR